MIRKLFILLLSVGFGLGCVGALFGTWAYFFIMRDLPQLTRIEDYAPPAVTRVVARDGTLLAEFYSERRYPVKMADVPDIVRKAFLAAEDASFYNHSGIDPVSILRAVYKNFQSGRTKQGASTITQQVVKNLLLSSEQTYDRKAREAVLAYRLESRFSKDEIFQIYLNQIFFGNTAYGVKAAARLYYHKELSELTLGEAALLAGLPKAPTDLAPTINPGKAKERQKQVLRQMVEAKFITEQQMEEALREDSRVYRATQQNVFGSPYYVGEVRRFFSERWKDLDLDADGLEVTTAVDPGADKLAQKALRMGLREVDKRRGWRGPRGTLSEAQYQRDHQGLHLEPDSGDIYPARVVQVVRGVAKVQLGKVTASVDLTKAGWARKFLERDDSPRFVVPAEVIKEGDVIEVSLKRVKGDGKSAESIQVELDQTPDIEGAVVLINPHSGEVVSMVGGYDYGASQFNRVTQSLRQPGSVFKPIVYLAAIDKFKYTPATIVHDAPRTFRVGDAFWTPANFDEKFLGPITLRTALEKSRNLVSADIVSRIGVDSAIAYARMLGITSPLGRNLSLSLGSSEVSLLELARAYGVFPAKGALFDSALVLKIKDRYGKVLYDYESEKLVKAKQVISEASSFVMANMMRGVVEHGTGYRIKELGRPVAGKTGTSNDQMDTWFIGYTPQWVCGVWVGFDQKKQIGPKETGGVVAAPVWLYFMRDFLAYKRALSSDSGEKEAEEEARRIGIQYVKQEIAEQLEFPVPDGVEPFWIYKSTGTRADPGGAGAFLEYFVAGTEPEAYIPTEGAEEGATESASSYLESPDL